MGWTNAATAAHRIGTYAAAIVEAHRFGFGPGDTNDLSSVVYQEKVLHVYAENLSWPYLLATARGFETNAKFMTLNAPPEDCPPESWLAIVNYLNSAAHVLTAYAPEGTEPDDHGVVGHTPSVMPFRELALVASARGAQTLELHARTVAEHCRTAAGLQRSPLDGDTERIMAMLVDGKSVDVIGSTLGFSERSIYRKLENLQEVTGTTSRLALVAHLMRRGWLS